MSSRREEVQKLRTELLVKLKLSPAYQDAAYALLFEYLDAVEQSLTLLETGHFRTEEEKPTDPGRRMTPPTGREKLKESGAYNFKRSVEMLPGGGKKDPPEE